MRYETLGERKNAWEIEQKTVSGTPRRTSLNLSFQERLYRSPSCRKGIGVGGVRERSARQSKAPDG